MDELDKVNAADTAALLSLMEGGRLVRAKKGRSLNVTVAIRVIAATNLVVKLSAELKSRFAIRKLKPYDAAQYRTVVKGVLVRREGVNPDLAEEIAGKLEGNSQDIRDAVRVARLSPQLGVDNEISNQMRQASHAQRQLFRCAHSLGFMGKEVVQQFGNRLNSSFVTLDFAFLGQCA